MDSQDILLWGEVKPEWTHKELERINSLCEWGKQYGIDGFVRCVSFLKIRYMEITNRHLQRMEMDL